MWCSLNGIAARRVNTATRAHCDPVSGQARRADTIPAGADKPRSANGQNQEEARGQARWAALLCSMCRPSRPWRSSSIRFPVVHTTGSSLYRHFVPETVQPPVWVRALWLGDGHRLPPRNAGCTH